MTSNDTNLSPLTTIEVTGRQRPPHWALWQRHMVDLMNRAARVFVERYTRPDGTLVWRKQWPGMDGSDDGYESFLYFPLFYILGGGEHVHELARRQWNAVTRQFTEYGQVYREFDAYYDWMHHGESYTYIYNLALADPQHAVDRNRALQFAAMYIGEDPEAPNWDPKLKMIRSAINGSRGPRFEMTAEDWITHRPVLARYLAPYEDIPGMESTDPAMMVDWTDDEAFAKVLKLMNERMVPGDIPLNLTATSLVTNAFLYTGQEKYRKWVLEYLQAWMARKDQNGGILPDNIGPSGKIGELMNGKWWGGYYGWRWPHGSRTILETTLIAGGNATLLTGDLSWFDLFRSQADLLWSLRKEQDGRTVVPTRHGDRGWFAYRPLDDRDLLVYIHLYFMSQEDQDRHRLEERFGALSGHRSQTRFGTAGGFLPRNWFAFVEGHNRCFPDKILEDTYHGFCQRLERIENDGDRVDEWDVHHWQERNPVIPEGLAQMAMGTPAAVYHGGLLHASVRFFDPNRHRPGLPEDVAALVDRVAEDQISLSLVNTSTFESRKVLIQAGTFGEHMFTEVELESDSHSREPTLLRSKYVQVRIGPSAQARLHLGRKRFVYPPSYEPPPMG